MEAFALSPDGPRVPLPHRVLSDERLLRLIAAGNPNAFGTVYARYHAPLHAYCRSIVRNDEDAHDALQNTMVKALAALGRSEERTIALKPWLFRIAHNESVTILRRRRSSEPWSDEVAPTVHALDRAVDQRARLTELVADLHELSERQRGALVMRELSGLSYEEIGGVLDISPGAARQSVFEARTALVEFGEGRDVACEAIRVSISDGDRRAMRARRVRAHLRACDGCRAFDASMRSRRRDLAMLLPALPGGGLLAVLQGALGLGAAGGGAAATTTAAVGVAGGGAAGIGALGGGAVAASTAAKGFAVLVAVTAAAGAGAAKIVPRVVEHRSHTHAAATAGSTPQSSSHVTRASVAAPSAGASSSAAATTGAGTSADATSSGTTGAAAGATDTSGGGSAPVHAHHRLVGGAEVVDEGHDRPGYDDWDGAAGSAYGDGADAAAGTGAGYGHSFGRGRYGASPAVGDDDVDADTGAEVVVPVRGRFAAGRPAITPDPAPEAPAQRYRFGRHGQITSTGDPSSTADGPADTSSSGDTGTSGGDGPASGVAPGSSSTGASSGSGTSGSGTSGSGTSGGVTGAGAGGSGATGGFGRTATGTRPGWPRRSWSSGSATSGPGATGAAGGPGSATASPPATETGSVGDTGTSGSAGTTSGDGTVTPPAVPATPTPSRWGFGSHRSYGTAAVPAAGGSTPTPPTGSTGP